MEKPIKKKGIIMSKSLRLFFYLGTACLVSMTPSRAESESGYRSLFDGETLDGWHIMEKPETGWYYATEENFFVKDGAIHCYQLPNKKGGLLMTDEQFKDFELVMDIQSDWGCDSGIFLRTTPDGRGIQVLNDYLPGGRIAFLFGQGTGGYTSRPIQLHGKPSGEDVEVTASDIYDAEEIDGLLYSIDAATWNRIWKHGEWNTIRIRCVGEEPVITTWINGEKIMIMDGSVYKGRSAPNARKQNWDAPSAFDQEAVHRLTGNGGSIALQVHPKDRWKPGGSARYKNIRIKEL